MEGLRTMRSRRIAAPWLCVAAVLGFANCSGDDEAPILLEGKPETVESSAAVSQSPPATSLDIREFTTRWAPALVAGRIDEVRALCSAWIEDDATALRLEGHKCLANVEISSARLPISAIPASGSDTPRPRFADEDIDAALRHYSLALAIAPRDRDAHLGRMDIMVLARRYRDANVALEETLQTFSSREYLDDWFRVLGRFRMLGAFEEGLEFLTIIETHHPLDHRLVANIGAYYAVLNRYDEALDYAKRAVSLNPDAAINQWNLARLYDQREEYESADEVYRVALALFRDEDPRARCDYARFLLKRMQDRERACGYAKTACREYYEEACLDENTAQAPPR